MGMKIKFFQGNKNFIFIPIKLNTYKKLMTVERIHPKAPVMLIFIAIFLRVYPVV